LKKTFDHRFFTLTAMISLCVFLGFYAGFLLGIDYIYMHFFYIPIIFAGLWYYKKAVYVAVLFGIIQILASDFTPSLDFFHAFGRAIIFVGVAYIVGTMSEKRAEETERIGRAKRQIETIINSSRDPISFKDRELRYIIINSAFVETFGTKSEDIVNRTDFDFMEKNDAEQWKKTDLNALDSEGPVKSEESIGGRYFDVVKQRVKDEAGKVYGVVAVIHDVTGRRRLEDEMRKLSTVVEQAADSIFITNRDGIIEYWNPALERSTGFSKKEAIGKTPRILRSGKHDKKVYEELWNTILSGQAYHGEMINRKKNGQLYYIERTITPIRDRTGNISHFVSIGMDITKRKQLEAELEKYTELLEREVQQRTQELIQSEKMAAIGVLVAGVAHEINNPLSYIKTNAEFLREDLGELQRGLQQPEHEHTRFLELEEKAATIIEGINRIAHITQALKRFAKPDAGVKAPSDVNQGLKDTLLILQNQLKHRIQIHEDYGSIPRVISNINQLNQVFMNMILNSSQAMEKGEIWIRTWDDARYAYIEIRDNGSGIAKENIGKIFDPFFTTKETGTGLGLSTSYKIIKEHRGDISVESELNKGTKITIKLPLGG